MTDLSSFETEIDALRSRPLLARPGDLQAKAYVAIGMILERCDGLVAVANRITAKQMERATSQLNEVSPSNLAASWSTLRLPCARWPNSWAEWFKRESASKWMEGLIREVHKRIEADWQQRQSKQGCGRTAPNRRSTTGRHASFALSPAGMKWCSSIAAPAPAG